ncbi:hypothetical protein NDU88_003293 [Pleurodeles waltl]|uniref:Uncharacterized protein n=1 Tax=Pleurodeles waltl TaxID=8319 RepID=A0AAV7RFH1_PLEWA|nr:hypothetical protein NDU88_003293 [Pleurodeles waltl]
MQEDGPQNVQTEASARSSICSAPRAACSHSKSLLLCFLTVCVSNLLRSLRRQFRIPFLSADARRTGFEVENKREVDRAADGRALLPVEDLGRGDDPKQADGGAEWGQSCGLPLPPSECRQRATCVGSKASGSPERAAVEEPAAGGGERGSQ